MALNNNGCTANQTMSQVASSRLRRWILVALLVTAGAWILWSAVFGGSGRAGDLDAKDFNILLITMDTTRADYIGCYGNKAARTPVLDRLAAEGVLFRNCVACTSVTAPSHSSIMTGLYPFVHAVRSNGSGRLAAGSTTLAEVLKEAGYATAAEIASAVLDHQYGLDQGFDTYRDVPREGEGLSAQYPTRVGDEVCETALKQLRLMAGDRFFFWLHFYDPHHPYEAPGFTGGDHPTAYAAEITFMDAQIGRLINGLGKLQIDRNTLVVLVGDHGEGLTEHGEAGHGYFVYDTTLRVPFIIWSPGTVPAGRRIGAQVRTIDIFPTLLELIGVEPEIDVQGVSLVPLLSEDEDDLGTMAYSETMIGYARFGMSPLRSFSDGRWKYVHAPSPSLFDLATDPLESKNLVDEHPSLAQEMREQLRALIADAPPPPPRGETTVTLSPEDEARLRALGYAGGAGGSIAGENEMDLFEPGGPDPRDHVRVIRQDNGAICAIGAKDFALAEKLFRSVTSAFPNRAGPLKDLAMAVALQERAEEACRLFQRAIDVDPANEDTRRQFTHFLLSEERWEEALQQLMKVLESSPDDVHVSYHLGLALVGLKRFDEAIKEFRRGMKLDPKYDGPARGVALALSRQDKLEEAVEWLRDAAAQHPDSVDLRWQLADALKALGRNDEALAVCQRALPIDPDNVPVLQQMGELLVDKGRYQEAEELLQRAVEIQPESPKVLGDLAYIRQMRGQTEEAYRLYQQALALAPDNTVVRAMFGGLLVTLQRWDEAFQEYTGIIELAPDHFGARYNLGVILARRGRLDEAREHLAQALQIDPTDVRVPHAIGVLYARQGDFEKAIEYFRKALEIDPDHKSSLRDLESARRKMEEQ